MAKNMALIENGIVVNILWCSDSEPETETLIDHENRPIGIGDTYDGEKFYRDGVEVLTPLEAVQAELSELMQREVELDNAYKEGVNSV
ncbi:MAG: hypothetical protein ACI3VA_07165 [Candidatus Limivicinus sp.]